MALSQTGTFYISISNSINKHAYIVMTTRCCMQKCEYIISNKEVRQKRKVRERKAVMYALLKHKNKHRITQ